jgi:D-xylose transport system permease protein
MMAASGSTGARDGAAPGQGRLAAIAKRLGPAEASSLRVLLGLVLIWGVFAFQNENFLSARNLTNLVLQIAAMGTISVGVVLILFLGEIDLSVGAVSGFGAAVMAVLNVQHGVRAELALLAGVLVGALIGTFQGLWFTRFRIPSFVVTLAGLLTWQGALLWMLGSTGTINVLDPMIQGLTGTFLPAWLGWVLGALAVLALVGSLLITGRRRQAAGLESLPTSVSAARVAVLAVIVVAVVALLNAERGVPLALVILVGLVIFFDFATRRTRFGRYVLAVGGNAEAARRAGIRVDSIRIAVYAIAGALASCGGMLSASRLLAVSQSSGGGDVLLNAIAAAVIGGTSLFGGRGTVWSALTGALVIGSISNGMDLLSLPSYAKFMVTGAALLLAVTIDGLARGKAASSRS